MQPALLFCSLILTSSWVLHASQAICSKGQYTINYSNGSFLKCLTCDTCHAGYGLYPRCGETLTYPADTGNIDCKPCADGTFSNTHDSAPCQGCHQCAENEKITAPCTSVSDTKCNGTCEKGYFFAKVSLNCQQCSYCCFDGKDDKQPECIKQGLNATGRYCSGRLDKQCGPLSTTAVTTQGTTVTHLPTTTHPSTHMTSQGTDVTHLPPTTNPSTHHPNTTTPAFGKVASPTHASTNHHTATIILSVVSGLLLAALVIGAILCQRKSRVWRRKRTELERNPPNIPIQDAEGRGPHNNDNNGSQQPVQTSPVNPRIQALQNTGYTSSSPSATPEVSPSATPQHSDDEVDELPDVVAVCKKRLLKRQSSKDAQSNAPNKEACANESLLDSRDDVQAANNVDFKGQDSKGGGQTRSRKPSLEALKRKFSFSFEKDDYQPLGNEDPDEPQENDQNGSVSKLRSGPTLSFKTLKRKLSLSDRDYRSVRIEDPDEDQSEDNIRSAASIEPIKIKVDPMHQKQKEGSRVEFKCSVQGKTDVFYQWIKDGTEMPGQNDSTLVLRSVELRDFGCYVCQVSFADSECDCKKSSAAMLDVVPRDGMVYTCLSEIDFNTKSKVETLLTKKIHGLGGWKQVADKYEMDKDTIESLEGTQDAGKETMSYLKGTNPDLKVYEFCKTLKERNIRRFDIVKELLSQLSVSAPDETA